MRIVWNSPENAFEAVFATGEHWNADQQAAKDAGFRTTGPPDWKWLAPTVKPLNALRNKRPPSGLTISDEAFEKFTPMQEEFEKNEVVLEQVRKLKKERAKTAKKKPGWGKPVTDEEGNWLPSPPTSAWVCPIVIARLTGPTCISCQDVLAFYERQQPPVCLWCERTVFKS